MRLGTRTRRLLWSAPLRLAIAVALVALIFPIRHGAEWPGGRGPEMHWFNTPAEAWPGYYRFTRGGPALSHIEERTFLSMFLDSGRSPELLHISWAEPTQIVIYAADDGYEGAWVRPTTHRRDPATGSS